MIRPMKKLAPKIYGPFKTLAKIGKNIYRLELQSWWWIHNIFYTSLLEPYSRNVIKGRSQIRPEPEKIEGQHEYKVKQILQSEIWETC
jgi:hypothetical protein